MSERTALRDAVALALALQDEAEGGISRYIELLSTYELDQRERELVVALAKLVADEVDRELLEKIARGGAGRD